MKAKILWLAALVVTAPSFAKEPSCSTIKSDKQRLACYDKAEMAATKQEQSTASSTPAAAAPTTKALKEGEVFKAGSWHVAQKLDAMTDKKSCTALYQGAWTIQGTTDTLYVSLSGRGGVKAYWLRIDDEPADELRLASDIERKISAADLGHSFNRIINSKRVRLQVSTILSTLLVEDINMAGFKEAVDYMKANCQA